MKLDDYAEFNDEKPDDDLEETGKKSVESSSAVVRVIMPVLVVGALVLVGIAVKLSFKNGENSTTDLASIPEPTVIQESKETISPVVQSSEAESSTESDPKEITTEFMPDNTQVTAKDVVNLRSMPSTTNENCVVLGTLSKGEVLTRTGINYELGWSKLDYNGQTVYAVTSYLEVVK